MTRFGVGLLFSLVFLSSTVDAKQTFDKSEIFDSNDVAAGGTIQITKCASKDCQLYAVAKDLTDIEANIVITKNDDVVITLKDLVKNNQGTGGFIKAYNLTTAAGYRIKNNNPLKTEISPFFVYVVQTDADYLGTAVYDASQAKTLKPPAEFLHSMATVLSAAPYFTLVNYDIGSAAGVEVYTSGFDSLKAPTKIFSSTFKELASKSITTITGPIATVLLAKLDAKATFSADIDLADRRTTSFEPGATVIAMSPGYSGTGTNYQSELGGVVSYKFTSSRVSPITMTIRSDTQPKIENVTITASGGNTKNSYTYGGNAVLNTQTFDADTIIVSWNRTDASSYFLAQFESSAVRMLPACMPLLIAALLRVSWA